MACASSLYIGIGVTFGLIVALFIATYTGLWGFMIEVLVWVRAMWDWFLQVMPRPAQILIFLFLIVTIADLIVGGILGMLYACTTTNNLRQPDGIASGLGMVFECGLEQTGNITAEEFDTYINSRTVPLLTHTDNNDARSMMRVECQGGSPRLTLYGLDFLNYKFWFMLILISGLYMAYSKFKRK